MCPTPASACLPAVSLDVTPYLLAKRRRKDDQVELARVQLFVEVLRCGDQGIIAARDEQRLPGREEAHIYSNGQNSHNL
jgi:hypothetical protein